MDITLFFLILFFFPDQPDLYSSVDTFHFKMLPRKMSASAMQRRTLNDPHLQPLALGLTRAKNTQMVTVQQKTRPLGTQPCLQWKRELSVQQERCGPNWQRNTQAVGRSQIRCTHTIFTSIIELCLFWERLMMRFCLVFLVSSFNSPKQCILYKIKFSLKRLF